MFSRLLAIAFCLAATPAFAITVVQEGNHYDYLNPIDDLLMTGGQVDHLDITGITADIRGGIVGTPGPTGTTEMSGGEIIFRGGNWLDHISSWGSKADLTFEGYYFRVYNRGNPENNGWQIEGFLADGTFNSISFAHVLCTCGVTIKFSIISGTSPIGDADGDWDVDLDDLNTIRNNFGAPGPGDLDQDGEVGLSDLNLVRNTFGFDDFTLRPNDPNSFPFEEITESTVLTPEPSSACVVAITSLVLAATTALRSRRKPTPGDHRA